MSSPLLPFLLFAFIASITPGPTNILVLSNSARYGLRAALPIILGACAGAAGIVLAVGSGLGESLIHLPRVQTAMQWVGVTWLSYLAWQIFSAPARAVETDTAHRRLGMIGAAGLQLVNPKTWMMALAVVSVFAGQGEGRQAHVLSLSIVFFLVSLPCLGVWAVLGAGSGRMLASARAMQRLNQVMAILLLVAAWIGVLPRG
ncbi:LysE family translocator [Pseudomonas sp. MIACH]|uniref:LysE family translocator n=1 Tax=Pseudomonas sp. MIACH TaxID=1078355 RepID=UPI00069EBF0E|nr:LysE family translocator [Pseudomonas sp. MIACH]